MFLKICLIFFRILQQSSINSMAMMQQALIIIAEIVNASNTNDMIGSLE